MAPVQSFQHFAALHQLKLCTSLLLREGLGWHPGSGRVGWTVVPSTSRRSRSGRVLGKEENEFSFHPGMLWNLQKSLRNWRIVSWLTVWRGGSEASGTNEPTGFINESRCLSREVSGVPLEASALGLFLSRTWMQTQKTYSLTRCKKQILRNNYHNKYQKESSEDWSKCLEITGWHLTE